MAGTAVQLGPAAQHVARTVPRSIRRRRLLVAVADHSILIALTIGFLAPFVFMVLTSLMTNEQSLSTNLWPHPFRFQNYVDVFRVEPLLRYALNTFLYAGLATLGLLLSSIPAAYALAVLRWRGRNVAFVLVLVTMMLPQQVTIVPLYILFSKLHLIGTIWPLVIPNWFGDAFSIFLLRQFFLTIPSEYADAARVDGCGELRILTSVYCRLAKPAIAAVALFSFLYCWNDFFAPLLYLNTKSKFTLQLGLLVFRGQYDTDYPKMFAATATIVIPIVLFFFVGQRYFIKSVVLSGLKG